MYAYSWKLGCSEIYKRGNVNHLQFYSEVTTINNLMTLISLFLDNIYIMDISIYILSIHNYNIYLYIIFFYFIEILMIILLLHETFIRFMLWNMWYFNFSQIIISYFYILSQAVLLYSLSFNISIKYFVVLYYKYYHDEYLCMLIIGYNIIILLG